MSTVSQQHQQRQRLRSSSTTTCTLLLPHTQTRYGDCNLIRCGWSSCVELSVRRTSTTGLVNGYVSSTTEELFIHRYSLPHSPDLVFRPCQKSRPSFPQLSLPRPSFPRPSLHRPSLPTPGTRISETLLSTPNCLHQHSIGYTGDQTVKPLTPTVAIRVGYSYGL